MWSLTRPKHQLRSAEAPPAPVGQLVPSPGLVLLRLRAPGLPVWVEAGGVAALVAVVYLLTLAGVHGEGDDAVFAAVQVREGDADGLFVPSHLIYNWPGWAVYNLARTLGYDGGPLAPMQALNALFGAIGIGFLWVFLRKVSSLVNTAVACGTLSFSYGYWFYSISVEVYVLSTLLLIVSFAAAFRAAASPNGVRFALLGMANGLAVLGHTTNVLFAAVAFAALVMALRKEPRGKVAGYGLMYVLSASLVVAPAYGIAAAVIGLSTPGEFYRWYTEITRAGDWGAWTSSSLLKASVGFSRALVGGHFLFASAEVRQVVEAIFGQQNPRDELFLVRNMKQGLEPLLTMPGAIVLLGVLASLYAWLQRPKLSPQASIVAWLCLAWLFAFVPFFVWWEPLNVEFWVAPLVPVAVLLALPLQDLFKGSRGDRMRMLGVGAFLSSLFLVNFFGSVLPQGSEANDYWRARVAWYEENSKEGDLVITAGHTWTPYILYFSAAEALDVFEVLARHDGDQEAALAEIGRRIGEPGHERVLISSEVFYPGAYGLSCCPDAVGASGIGLRLREELSERLHLVEIGDLEWVWELER